eukprot:GHVP01025074.1.p1 GENE.GHVP01025074.1~~GHVP01025074.1.p1  ORF type:complete len:288 (-),score=52.84 GHVP01025074.1:1051-1914(-)
MEILSFCEEVRRKRKISAKNNRKVVWVPMMGGLHEGHKRLVVVGKSLGDEIWCSLFLNPKQFQDPLDFKNYPSSMSADLKILEDLNVDVVYTPSYDDLFPTVPFEPLVDFHNIEEVPGEGQQRPKFFQGIGSVCARFFALLEPSVAVFGQKDFLQCCAIKSLAKYYFPKTEIQIVGTVRDPDGLACSTRNARLSEVERSKCQIIPLLFQSLRRLFPCVLCDLRTRAKKIAAEKNIEFAYLTFHDWESGRVLPEEYAVSSDATTVLVAAGEIIISIKLTIKLLKFLIL